MKLLIKSESGDSSITVSENDDLFEVGDTLRITSSNIALNGESITTGKVIVKQSDGAFEQIAITMVDISSRRPIFQGNLGGNT